MRRVVKWAWFWAAVNIQRTEPWVRAARIYLIRGSESFLSVTGCQARHQCNPWLLCRSAIAIFAKAREGARRRTGDPSRHGVPNAANPQVRRSDPISSSAKSDLKFVRQTG